MSKAKQPVGKLKSSPTSNGSGVKFLKTFAPSIRRRRQCDKEKLEIYNLESNNDNFNVWDAIPASPITPPAAFLPPGYKRSGKSLTKVGRSLSKFGSLPSPQTSLNANKYSGWVCVRGGLTEILINYLKHLKDADGTRSFVRLLACSRCTDPTSHFSPIFPVVILLLSGVLSEKGGKNQFKVPVHAQHHGKCLSRCIVDFTLWIPLLLFFLVLLLLLASIGRPYNVTRLQAIVEISLLADLPQWWIEWKVSSSSCGDFSFRSCDSFSIKLSSHLR